MKTSNITVTKSVLFALAIATAAGACAGESLQEPTEGNAYLSIVGDRNVLVDYGQQKRIQVRYHNSADEPLAGQVDFTIVGDAQGASLSANYGPTNSSGVAEINVVGGTNQTSFRIQGKAPYAQSVEWTIVVNEGAQPLPPLDPEGTYKVESNFDIVSGAPGDAGEAVNKFIAMTDDPYDPGTYIIDRALEEMDNSFIEGAIQLTRPSLDEYVNDKILEASPDFIQKLIDIGNMLGDISKKFGTISEFKVAQSGGEPERKEVAATHTMTGFAFKIDGEAYEYDLNDLGSDEPVVKNITINMESNQRITVGQHDMPIKYGAFLAIALNEVIVPAVDPSAYDLPSLFQNNVDCYSLGYDMSEFVGTGSPSFYENACNVALLLAANIIIDQLANIDVKAPVILKISGEAKANDTNSDRKVDTFSVGRWKGMIDYDGTAGPLAEGANFIGNRMGN